MGSLRDELAKIHQQKQRLTAEAVVEAAAPVSHPLHNRFEWDDSVAGHKYRLVQATDLIRSVEVNFVVDETPIRVREWHAVRRDSTYEPIGDVIEDEFTTQLMLRQAEREWTQLWERYQHLSQFIDLIRSSIGKPPNGPTGRKTA